jgi:hypothetical protein
MSPAAISVSVPGGGGGAFTVMSEVPVLPPPVAEMVALPGATGLVTAVADTVAIDAALDDQAKLTPLTTFPFRSSAVAVSCTVWPGSRVAVAGVTLTRCTDGAPPPFARKASFG